MYKGSQSARGCSPAPQEVSGSKPACGRPELSAVPNLLAADLRMRPGLGAAASNNDLSLVAQLKIKTKIKRLIDATAKNKIYGI